MFCCIGMKVKWLAKLILWLGSAASVMLGIIAMVVPTLPAAATFQPGWLIIVLGVLGSVAISWIIYAIGTAAAAAERR